MEQVELENVLYKTSWAVTPRELSNLVDIPYTSVFRGILWGGYLPVLVAFLVASILYRLDFYLSGMILMVLFGLGFFFARCKLIAFAILAFANKGSQNGQS